MHKKIDLKLNYKNILIMKKFIKETIIEETKLDELDFEVEKLLIGEDSIECDIEFYYDDNNNFRNNEGDNIPLYILKDIINDLEEKGSTHIQIEPHYDHHGYIITGTHLELIPDNDSKLIKLKKQKLKNEIKLRESKIKQDRDIINKREKEINELYNELDNLENNKKNE